MVARAKDLFLLHTYTSEELILPPKKPASPACAAALITLILIIRDINAPAKPDKSPTKAEYPIAGIRGSGKLIKISLPV